MLATAPCYDLYATIADKRLEAAMQTDPDTQWPEAGGAYQQLMEAERRAQYISCIGTELPGWLADEVYIDAAVADSAAREQKQDISRARHQLVTARLASGDCENRLSVAMFLPDDILKFPSQIGQRCPDRIPYQAFQLYLAAEQGLRLQFVRGNVLRGLMGTMNTSIIATYPGDEPKQLVYREYHTGNVHESVATDSASLADAAALELRVRMAALSDEADAPLDLNRGSPHVYSGQETVKALRVAMEPALAGTRHDLHFNYE